MEPTLSTEKDQAISGDTIDVSVNGKWVRVPTFDINGKNIIVKGRWIRVAAVHDEDWLETELEDPKVCVKRLKQHGSQELSADIFTFMQKLPATVPKYRYPLEWVSLAVVRLASFREWWDSLPQETRKNVRRSQKRGVVVTVKQLDDDLVREIVGVNNDSPIVQGRSNRYYGKKFDEVKKDHSAFLDRSDLICAHFGNELVGFLKVVYRGEVASILGFLTKASHSDKRPANALIAKAVECCAARGTTYLTYGKFNYGNKRNSPLREFKIRNGFGEVLVPRFYVPLTVRGMIYMKLKLHRGLLGILPHRVIALGVSARARWLKIKQSTRRCSSMVERPNSNRQMGCSNPPAGSNS